MQVQVRAQDPRTRTEPNRGQSTPVYFNISINKVQENIKLPPEDRAKTFLGRYETRVKGGLEKLYFPLNVNGNHWIAVLVDFKEKVILFGAH